MSDRCVVWVAATVFYTVAIALAAYAGWMAAGAAGAALTILVAGGAAVWAVTASGRAA